MNGWRLRLFVGVERLLARLGLKLPGKIMYIGGSDTLPPPLSRDPSVCEGSCISKKSLHKST